MIENPSPPKTTNPLIYFILLIIVIPVFYGLGIGTGYLFWGRSSGQTPVVASPDPTQVSQAEQPTQTPGEPRQVTRYDVPEDDDPSIGPQDAEIVIIEFSDYQCPACQKWHNEVYDQLMAEYPGQIRFIYRDYPLGGHPEAIPAAVAANCAGEQGSYWKFHEALFSMQYDLNSESYSQYASDLALDLDAFNACVAENRYYDEVLADLEYASNLGVRATPTFFINGIPIEGVLPFESFKQLIDMELAGELK